MEFESLQSAFKAMQKDLTSANRDLFYKARTQFLASEQGSKIGKRRIHEMLANED